MVQRIYTRTGDMGETGLFGGGRVAKSDLRVEAYGEVDELNATLGWARAVVTEPTIGERLLAVQPDLFAIGAHLATKAPAGRPAPALPPLPEDRIDELEQWIDEGEAGLPALRAFILPGGSPGGAALHVARTVCRRAERRVVELAGAEEIASAILVYLNRLSDLLFVWSRVENRSAGTPEQEWLPRTSR
ncbi:MAG: cob(I)yrinic acid a,c-diamide adenosyltransferase [Gemmatimonadota bacterium]